MSAMKIAANVKSAPSRFGSPRTRPRNALTNTTRFHRVTRTGQRLRSRNAASAVTAPLHYLGDGVLIRRANRALPRIEIRLERSAEVRARDEVATRTGKGMLDQRLRTLSLSYAHVELAKFRFRKGGP